VNFSVSDSCAEPQPLLLWLSLWLMLFWLERMLTLRAALMVLLPPATTLLPLMLLPTIFFSITC
jgi:hypothetical protein